MIDSNRRVYSGNGVAPTVTTCNGGNTEPKIVQRPHGYNKGAVLDECPSITTSAFQENNLLAEPLALDEQNRTIRTDGTVGTLTTDGSSPKHNNRVIEPIAAAMRGRNPDNPSDRTAGIPTQQRIEFGGEVSNALMTVQKDSLVAEPIDLTNCRVRKLTEKECFRLQGVKDDDFEKIAENQSRSSRYHLAGDSITSTVLMAIFGELLNMDYKSKIKDVVTDITKEHQQGDTKRTRGE